MNSITSKNWHKDPINKIPTKRQMLEAIAQYKKEPITVKHNCTIRSNALQPTDLKGLRGHCTQCSKTWIREMRKGRLSPGWTCPS